jgi:hypothetical protein
VADCVYASMNRVEAAAIHQAMDPAAAKAGLDQLGVRYDAVLLRGPPGNPPSPLPRVI